MPAPTTAHSYFDLPRTLHALEKDMPVTFPPMSITRAKIGGKVLTFCSNYEQDPVQSSQRAGRFYEEHDLAKIRRHLPSKARILDVGANVGNHALYFATQCEAQSVIVIEPNPIALAPLVANILMNDLRHVIKMDFLGIGLGATSQDGFEATKPKINLGSGKLLKTQAGGGVSVHPGDALFANEHFDLIKIDVEGMEMEVLAGLEKTIARCRPWIFFEARNENVEPFQEWFSARSYTLAYRKRYYRSCENFLIQPPSTP